MRSYNALKISFFWIVIVTGLTVAVIAWQRHVQRKRERRQKHGKVCSSCASTGAGTLPLMDPEHNIREIIKQLVLLEDHCAHGESKFCEDCVTKHAMAAEALAEEAITLDTLDKFTPILQPLASSIRNIQKSMWNGDLTPSNASKEYRAIRKTLMPHANAMFGV